MGGEAWYQISLVAAFVAGMVALFAPCCITYLLPAYFGNVFKERRRVLLMTMVYSAGIFVVMLPVVLGAKILTQWLWRWHDQTYLVGSGLMILVAGLALLGIKLPMPKRVMSWRRSGTDVLASFTLGLVSGVTSACCAPVLVGVITLSSLSPTILQSLGVGAAYVLGMVAPLYVAAALIDRGNWLEKPFFRRHWFTIRLGEKQWPVYTTNLVAAIMFLAVGLVTLWLTVTGRLAMPTGEMAVTSKINRVAWWLTERTDELPGLDIIFVGGLLYLIYRLVRKLGAERDKQ